MLGISSNAYAYQFFDIIFNQIAREDFILEKDYKIVEAIDNTYGKWPRAYGNAVFLDSKFMVENFVEMFYQNTIKQMERNNYG